jgi:integrase
MGRRKKEITWPHVNNCKGNMKKQWYVEFVLTHPISGEKIQKRIYEGFNELTTYYERMELADKYIDEWTNKIESGWRPWAELKPFSDELAYKNSQTFSPGLSTEKSYIKPMISDYLKHKTPEVNKSTLDDYRSKLRQFCFYLESEKCENRELSFYDNDFMVAFLRKLHDKGMSRATVTKYRQVLSELFKFIRKIKKIKIDDPFDEDIPRLGKIVDMSPASIPERIREMFRRECEQDDPQLWLAINFVYFTAIRPRAELRFLKIKNINFSAQCVTVINELSKNNRTETIDIPDHLYNLIVDVWKLHLKDGELYVFGKNGQPGPDPLGKNTLGYRFVKVRERLGLPSDVKLYSFKHSSSQELVINNANIFDIQAHMRHKNLETTVEYLKKRFGNRNTYLKKNFPGI